MDKTMKILNLIFFVAMIVVNALGEILPLGVGTTGAISTKYKNLFTPAPITFSIWGIIYVMVAIFVFYQLDLTGNNDYASAVIRAAGIWFIISCAMNIGWMISWHYEVIWLSLVFMIGLLFSLIMITSGFHNLYDPPFLARISGYGFGIYLGWICAATIANVSAWLISLNWNRFGLSEQFCTILAIIIGGILGILFILTRRNYFAAAAIIWAYCGILIKHISEGGYAGKYPLIITTTIIAIVLILAVGIVKMIIPRDMMAS